LVEVFVGSGHRVYGCGRSQPAIDALAIRHGAPHDFAVVDVSVDLEVRDWAKRVVEEYGPPDLLINNAAIINANAPLWLVPAEEFDAVVDINLKGMANVLRHFLPVMVQRQEGIVVNFSSGWGRSTSPEVAPYCATKWAVEGLTQAVAQELPAGMAAIPLNPGIIDTAMLRSCFGDSAGSYPSAAAWAERAVPFLLRLTARHNGQSLSVSD
jgi:NAD(P)-dependent dehydrogenase (short-subunit alcohol dehydrogenase family)